MNRFAIHGRVISAEVQPHIQSLIDELRSRNASLAVTQIFSDLNPIFQSQNKLSVIQEPITRADFDAFISLGGDGTFLETLTFVGALQIPILGVNTGRLGFLASISKEHIKEAVGQVFADEIWIEKRILVSLETNIPLFDGKNFALNEFSILRKETSSMIVVKTFINGNYLNTYWADGLMVATPTGSTGYNLSCGGPIILPDTNNFIITPVSPHNLNIRPLIVPDKSILEFHVESRNKEFLISLDSRSTAVDSAVSLKITKAQFFAHIIRLKGTSFIDTLRNKLSWGLDNRN